MRRRVVAACLLALASACGPSTPPSAPGDLLARDPEAAGESSRLAVPEPLIDISLIVRDLEGFYLFEDEQLEAANIVAAWAKTAHLAARPPARTREIMQRAANGQHALTGKACGGPLWSLAALERWREDIRADGRIETTVACLPKCVLIVKVSEGLDVAARDAGRTALWSAPFDPSRPWREELPLRLAQVAPQPVLPDATPRVEGARPRPARVDGAFAALDEEPLPPALISRAQTCLGDVGAIGLVLETDAAGAITRCETFAHRIVANGPVAACACTALVGGRVAGGARRLATTITLAAGSSTVVTKGGKLVDAHIHPALKRDAGTGAFLPIVSHRSIREWEPPMPWTVATCFAGLAATAPAIRAHIKISVDGATTRVASSKIDVTDGSLTPAQSACLDAAITRATKVPCPEPGTHTMDAELVVEQRDP